MRALLRLQDALLALLAIIGALAIGALMLHVFADVVLRNVSNKPIPATYEIVTNYYMIALAFIPLAWVERGGGMVQVEVDRQPS
jgi:TRAP-type C4-dicarboxylate transport system permease small subunit